jgi:hypothetical protein
VQGLGVWKLCLALCLQNLWFISVKKLAAFSYVVGVSLPWKFKLILRILNWSANERKNRVFQPITVGKSVGGVALDSEG